MNRTHFWLIRHGETDWNVIRRIQGWQDVPLNEAGEQQARRLGEHLRSTVFTPRIDVVVSSDLRRAYDTAQLAAGHFVETIEPVQALRERGFGIYEGQNWTMLNGAVPEEGKQLNFRDPDQAVEGGETLNVFYARVIQAFEDLARLHAGRNVMVFSHGGVIDMVSRKASGRDLGALRLDLILNTSINEFSIAADQWQIESWGQVHHLDMQALDDTVR